MCFKPKIPKMEMPEKPLDPTPLASTPTGVEFGGSDETPEDTGRKSLTKIKPKLFKSKGVK